MRLIWIHSWACSKWICSGLIATVFRSTVMSICGTFPIARVFRVVQNKWSKIQKISEFSARIRGLTRLVSWCFMGQVLFQTLGLSWPISWGRTEQSQEARDLLRSHLEPSHLPVVLQAVRCAPRGRENDATKLRSRSLLSLVEPCELHVLEVSLGVWGCKLREKKVNLMDINHVLSCSYCSCSISMYFIQHVTSFGFITRPAPSKCDYPRQTGRLSIVWLKRNHLK